MLNTLPASTSDKDLAEVVQTHIGNGDPEVNIPDARLDAARAAIERESLEEMQRLSRQNGNGRGFHHLVNSFKEWRNLQAEIHAFSATVVKKRRDIEEGLANYRIVLTGAIFKSQKLDEEIWSNYFQSQENIPHLLRKTRRIPLFLLPSKTLRELNHSWREVVYQQDLLLSILEKAPKSVDFYNRVHLARIKKREQELRDAEIARRNAQTREAIERALSKAGIPDQEGNITLGSKILRLEDASNYWNQRLTEITSLERSGNIDPDELITILQNLQETINEAPSMAERVREVEVMFVRLLTMHEELASYGRTIIPQDDLAKALVTMQEEVPRLWATGDWEKLRRSLNDITSFVKFYDLPVRSELAMSERRKVGAPRAFLGGAASLPIAQAIPLIRALVAAIDARDRFMKGHSDMVAQLAVQTARRLNWSNEDVEMLEVAALLHDVGKIVIPENVLTKTEPLNPDEWKAIQMHPYHSARIVRTMEPLSRIVPWVYHHQERWDGSGYPDGLSANSIPNGARIISVGEAYTVMITDQPQRPARSTDEALGEITKAAGTQFDPEIAAAFIETVEASNHTGEALTSEVK